MRALWNRLSLVVLALGAVACVPMVERSQFAIDRQDGGAAQGQAPASASGQRMVGGVYDGALRNGVPEGPGVFAFNDGRRYEGQFRAGRMDGQGRMSYPDGRVVSGQFASDAERAVKLRYRDGREFDGAVVNGVPQGSGTMRYPNGARTTGQFANGRPHGLAYQQNPNGTGFFGPFKGGVPSGSGVCAGGGGSSMCDRDGDRDVTAQAIRDAAAASVARETAAQERAAREAAAREHAERQARLKAEMDALRNQRQRQGGPTRDGDFNCYCTIATICLTVTSSDDRTPAEVRRLQDERRRLECRQKYADWLQIKASPDYAQRLAALDGKIGDAQRRMNAEEAARQQRQREVDAYWARQKADQDRKRRLEQEAAARYEAERQRELDKQRQRCSQPEVKRVNPCRCSAILNIPLPSTQGVCEA